MYVFVYAPERFVKSARPTTFFFAPPACAGGRRNGIAISGSREEIRAGGGRVNNHASDHSEREQRNSKAGEVPGREPGAGGRPPRSRPAEEASADAARTARDRVPPSEGRVTEERRDGVAEQIEVLHERREEFARGTRARDASLEIAPAESSAGLRSAL